MLLQQLQDTKYLNVTILEAEVTKTKTSTTKTKTTSMKRKTKTSTFKTQMKHTGSRQSSAKTKVRMQRTVSEIYLRQEIVSNHSTAAAGQMPMI